VFTRNGRWRRLWRGKVSPATKITNNETLILKQRFKDVFSSVISLRV
jgi:hypothetical protein